MIKPEVPQQFLRKLESAGYPSKEWFEINRPIEELIDPAWQPHPERLLHEFNPQETNPNGIGSGRDIKLEKHIGPRIFDPKYSVLDVGGGSGAEPFTLLRQGPFVYLIDPLVNESEKFCGAPPVHPHRAVKGFAEDMPFKDGVFAWSLAHKSLGWYPKSINPFWAIHEMIRVSRNLVTIALGQDISENKILLSNALEEIKSTEISKRIKAAQFRELGTPQLSIVLHEN